MLSEFGGSQLSSAAQQAVATAATSLITQGIASMTNIQAKLGSTQSAVTNANSSMSSQLTILQTANRQSRQRQRQHVGGQLNSLTNQIQTAYQLTAQLQKLNLAQYLPIS